MNIPARRVGIASVTAIVLSAATMIPAQATDQADATADLISKVTTDARSVVTGTVAVDSLVASAGDVSVTVPLSGNDAVSLERATFPTGLEISLPRELDLGAGAVADDGTVVYHDGRDSAAVQVLEGGSMRIQTVTADVNGPHEFTYSFGDAVEPVLAADGTVALVEQFDGGFVQLGTVEPAWAVDAAGADVPTSYRVQNGLLVQVVTPGANAEYPLVADPTVSLGWNIYVTYDRAETKLIASNPLTDKAKYLALVCAVIPNAVVATGCGLATYDIISSIASTFTSAKAVNKCTQIGYIALVLPSGVSYTPVSWHVISC